MAPAQNTRLQLGKRKAQATQGGSPVTKGKTRVAKDKSRVAKGKNQVAEGKKKQAAKGNKKQATVVQTSSLLKLPGELKNRIYEYALIEERPIKVGTKDLLPPTPPLLQTCKQTRADASGIFYAENVLHIDFLHYDVSKVVRWLEASPVRDLLYRRSKIHMWTEPEEPIDGSTSESLWKNMLTWVKYYCERRCRRVCGHRWWPEIESAALSFSEARDDFIMVRVFDLVDELLKNNEELTTDDIISHLKGLRRAGTLPPRPS